MTLAICIRCGHKKLGALTPCGHCRFQPNTSLDKAKSISLSDHNLSASDLETISQRIERGEVISYDDASLAQFAQSIDVSEPKRILGIRRTSWIALAIAVFAGIFLGSCFASVFHLFGL